MAHGHDSKEKIVYVGDSRVRKKTAEMLPQDYTAYPGKSEAFVPNFLLKEWMVGAVVLVGFLVLVMSEKAPLGYPADPTNTSFIPMPDWYFLFLYQLLKYPYTSEHFKLMGTFVFPGIAFGSLLLAPFLDTGPERRFYRRPIAASLMIVTLLAVSYLTYVSEHHYQQELKAKGIIPEPIKREQELAAAKKAGQSGQTAQSPSAAGGSSVAIVNQNDPAYTIFQKATCVMCHGVDMKGNTNAGIPALRGVGDKLSKAQIIAIMKNGRGNMPPGQWDASIAKGLTADQMNQLADWLSKQKASSK